MFDHSGLSDLTLFRFLKSGEIRFAGNKRLQIYGQLSCRSGKRMNKMNRVFFNNEEEAREEGFRPCGHCMKEAYVKWKNGII